jgi:hypothetical protein
MMSVLVLDFSCDSMLRAIIESESVHVNCRYLSHSLYVLP